MTNPVRGHVESGNGVHFVPQEANRRKPEYADKIILRCGFQLDIASSVAFGKGVLMKTPIDC